MNISRNSNRLKLPVLAILALIIPSIAILHCMFQKSYAETGTRELRLALFDRVIEFHKALVELDYPKQYTFFSPEFREKITLQEYVRHLGEINEEILKKTGKRNIY